MAYEQQLSDDVVRIDDTVRRPRKPWSISIQLLLDYLHGHGFDSCPKPLGFDEEGRSVEGFIHGLPWHSLEPGLLWSDSTLIEACRLLAAFHKAQAGFVFEATAPWCSAEQGDGPAEVVCHNDFGLHNLIFRERSPFAIVDFDLAAPGSRLWDLAFCAISTVPLNDPADRRPAPLGDLDPWRRLRLMCNAYGLGDERQRLPEVIQQRVGYIVNGLRAAGREGVETLRVVERTRAYVAAHWDSLLDSVAGV